MISICPHCNKDLGLTEVQVVKVKGALAKLPEGGTLKLGCPACKKPIVLMADGSLSNATKAAPPESGDSPAPKSEGEEGKKAYVPKPINPPPDPPQPPDISWMASGDLKEKEVVEDKQLVLILMPEGEARDTVVQAYKTLKYAPTLAESAEDAVERMRFVTFSAVVFHAGFEGGSLDASVFHSHMCSLAMARRRYMYYILIGPQFHTLYDLEALAYSANVVIKEEDVSFFDTILKKGMRDYEALFGPLLLALKAQGKS